MWPLGATGDRVWPDTEALRDMILSCLFRSDMRLAVIDIGTNSVKLLVGERRGQRVATVREEARITRVGEGLEKRGRLSAAAMLRTAETVQRFARTAEKADVCRVLAVGTAALRRAKNKRDFTRLVWKYARLKVRILSGSQEAFYSFIGGLSGLSFRGDVILVDVGGGSTELILGRGGVPLGWHSVSFGAVSLTERFLRHDPPKEIETSHLYEYARLRLERSFETAARRVASKLGISAASVSKRYRGPLHKTLLTCDSESRIHKGADRRLVIVGGTAAALASILGRQHGEVIQRVELLGLFERLRKMSVTQRMRTYHLPHGRADIVVAGAAILIAITQLCNQDDLIISRRGLRHGILLTITAAVRMPDQERMN